MTSFAELTKQVHLINDLILADMTCGDYDNSKEVITFGKHLLATKYWYARISHANKKKYLLALVHDVRSAWALSLLLKSLWNCQPKDAVMSISEPKVYSSYDQVPMDHNRTAMPPLTLAQVMKTDRFWFNSLEPEAQALVLSELSTVAGGPVMWEVLRVARQRFEQNRDLMLKNITAECIVNDHPVQTIKSDQSQNFEIGDGKRASASPTPSSDAQKAYEASIATWNATIKSMADSLKLEEIEMTFNDGSQKKIWKVNRPKPESVETVDMIQLLPSSVSKKIFSYLPNAQLGDYAKVNKYWLYLVDELKAEQAARIKITAEVERLHELVLRYDVSLEVFFPNHDQTGPLNLSVGLQSTAAMPFSQRGRHPQPSLRPSEKSAGAYSQKNFISEKLTKPMLVLKPLLNMADLSERLERRGAADENIWKWCRCIMDHANKIKMLKRKPKGDGVLSLGNVHFPCPLMKVSMEVPVFPPLYKDPVMITSAKPKIVVTDSNLDQAPNETIKRYTLWARNHSPLYHVFKVPSYIASPES